jgi:PAS domain-containing protein
LAIAVLIDRQMLPSSHLEPINALPADNRGAQALERAAADESEMPSRGAVLLASAFTEFISASSRLESSYRELQDEVSELRVELSARNAALSTSLAENERMRLDLQQIVDSMPCGVLVLDRRGEISMINPESGRLLGLDGTQFPKGSRATLRQISNLLMKMHPAATPDWSSASTVLQENVGSRFVIAHSSTSQARAVSPTGRS